MASRHMLSLCCSSGWSGSMLPSVLQSELSPLLSPFTSTTSQWLLDASVTHNDSDAIASPDAVAPAVLPSVSVCGSTSGLAAPSRFSLLLESRCLLPSWGRRSRPGLRPPLLVFGLPEGLLVRLREGADFLLDAGEAVGETTGLNALPLQLGHELLCSIILRSIWFHMLSCSESSNT